MRILLKNLSLGATSLLMAAFSYAAVAAPLTRPYTSSDYLAGRPAVGPKVNAEFDNIVTWVNGGNIASGNVAGLSLVGANIAPNTITQDKLHLSDYALPGTAIADGSIPVTKLATPSMLISNMSTAFFTTSVVPTPLLSGSITTSGRPVRVTLEAQLGYPYGANTGLDYGSAVIGGLSTSGKSGAIFFVRDGSTTAHFPIYSVYPNSGVVYSGQSYPCSAFSYTETSLAAGMHTIEMRVSAVSGSSMTLNNCRMVIREE